ncbi:hypothetical protein SAMCCGM7_Ch2430 [Sinorhizobium americanum CCGM7]|nr:hypothetical protein SAMCCGM7_Ch2430 [Sinorhizobium americanum CCGM7]
MVQKAAVAMSSQATHRRFYKRDVKRPTDRLTALRRVTP